MHYSGSFIPILHEYVMIVRKDNPLVIPILATKRIEADVRDMPGATWKDVVAGVMEEKGKISLSHLYAQIEPYKKAKQNRWWKEKVRQTLYSYPDCFCQTEKGVWQLIKRNKSRHA